MAMINIPKKQKPELLATRPITNGRLYDFEQCDLRFQNGVERQFMRIKARSPEAVLIVPMLDDETVLLIREYGTGIDDYYLGFPKGALDNSEDILHGANRELMEEVGYGAHDLEVMKSFTTSPGYMTSRMHFVLARQLYPKRLPGDEPEAIDVFEWKLRDIDALLAREDFHEARSIAALLWVARRFA